MRTKIDWSIHCVANGVCEKVVFVCTENLRADNFFNAVIVSHKYDHSFPLRYKAQKGYEIQNRHAAFKNL